LSRDQEDIAHVFKRVSFAGGRIVTLSEGEINELHIGLKGTMGALYLKDLADKTRRGLRGRVEAGKSGGGNSYGYDVVRGLGADGQPLTGERRINAREAAIVRRIFEEYAAGVSPRAIAKRFNTEGVPGPSGKAWGPSTHPWQPPARHRHSQGRTLYRQAGLEPPALREGPGDRKTGVPA
jgi:site-specific DNA recombinase